MRVAIFTIEYTISDFGWGRNPVPQELRSDCRIPLFRELIRHARDQRANLAVLTGGFFRTDFPGGIVNAFRYSRPEITVLVGCDNVACREREVWVIVPPNGRITRRIPEAWIAPGRVSQPVLRRITDRRFQLRNRKYAIFCCGDILVDTRRAPITGSRAAFVLAHYGATGRGFAPSMRNLGIPVFLSHHVKHPYDTVSFAYNGRNNLAPIEETWGESQGLKWVARIYSV